MTTPYYDYSKKSSNTGGFWGNLLKGNWLGSLWDIGTGIYDRYNENKWANINWEAQKEQQKYERDLQQTIFDREDNAVSRRVEDMRNAGINPVMAAGAAAQAGTPIKTDVPERARNVTQLPQIMEMLMQREMIGKSKAERNLINAQTDSVRDEIKMRKSKFRLEEERVGISREELRLNTRKFNEGIRQFELEIGLELRRIGISESQLNLMERQFKEIQEMNSLNYWLNKGKKDDAWNLGSAGIDIRLRAQENTTRLYNSIIEAQQQLTQMREYLNQQNRTIPPKLRGWLDLMQGTYDNLLRLAQNQEALFD